MAVGYAPLNQDMVAGRLAPYLAAHPLPAGPGVRTVPVAADGDLHFERT
ncbi:protein of unknown function [Candidatus Hydrogenisulfobacillus filiaventi]|uniref:Uncharacterized protein n=1 Tax=Candidatus Hydrogenisulfobacillus filiaventi TaxID=2707344 RepID=A0A6F8ZFF6_9FIRM|nr:protein of unknown function [Candidatus Hydrogenisulfobacillus filiaventi]